MGGLLRWGSRGGASASATSPSPADLSHEHSRASHQLKPSRVSTVRFSVDLTEPGAAAGDGYGADGLDTVVSGDDFALMLQPPSVPSNSHRHPSVRFSLSGW